MEILTSVKKFESVTIDLSTQRFSFHLPERRDSKILPLHTVFPIPNVTLNLKSFEYLDIGFENISKHLNTICDSFQSLTVYVNKFLRANVFIEYRDMPTLEEVYTALSGHFTAMNLTITVKKLIDEPKEAYIIEESEEPVRLTFTVKEGGEVEVARCGVDTKRNIDGKVQVSDSGWWTWLGYLPSSLI